MVDYIKILGCLRTVNDWSPDRELYCLAFIFAQMGRPTN